VKNLAVLVRDESRAAFERHGTTQVTPIGDLECASYREVVPKTARSASREAA
jgi:hypothetical protein